MNTTKVERKKEKKLNREHWMCRIQKFSFNIDAPTFYMGYCPFFWMTWLALLVSPIVAVFRIVTLPTLWAWNRVSAIFVEKREISRTKLREIPLEPSWLQMLNLEYMSPTGLSEFDIYYARISRERTDCARIALWLSQNPAWKKTHLPAAKAKKKQIQEAEAARKAAARKREKTLRKVNAGASLCGSFIFKILIPTAILAAVSVVFYGLYQAALAITLVGTLWVAYHVAFISAALMSFYLLFNFLTIVKDIRDSKKTIVAEDEDSPGVLFRTLSKIGECFANSFEFIRDTVYITYKQECPLIIWGTETGPIQKRNKNN